MDLKSTVAALCLVLLVRSSQELPWDLAMPTSCSIP